MVYFSLTGFINGLTAAILGWFVYSKNKYSPVHQRYALFNLAVFFWSFGYIFWPLAHSKSETLYWFRVLHVGAIFIPVCFLHFVVTFLEISRKKILIFGYLLSVFFVLFSFSSLYIKDMRAVSIFPYWGVPGVLYYPFLVMFLGYAVYACYILYKAYRHVSDLRRKQQIRYIFIGMVIGYIGGSSNYLLFFKFPIPPYLNVVGFIYVAMFAFAILKYKLLDIEVIIKRGLVYSILAGVVTAIFFTILLVTEKFFQGLVGYQSLIVTVIVGFIITLGFNPLKNQIQRFIDRRFFKGTMEEMAYQNERLMQQIQQADKLKAVATLAAGMAHEIKNPLTAIKTFSQYLPQKYADADFINKYGQIVPREIERINRIVTDVLLFSKPKEPNFKEVNINNLLSDSLDFLSNDFLNKNIKVVKEFSLKDAVVSADPDQLKQVFLNLFLNALDAMDFGGTLTVEVRDGSAHNGKDNIDRTVPFLQVSIADTGCGISEENLKHIFEPFHTTKSNGTGLGLAVVRNIMNHHKADIKVESEVGKGTRFIIRFPA